MATPKSQRIVIIIIAIVMTIGSIGTFAVLVLSTENNKGAESSKQAAYDKYLAETKKQEAELSKKHFVVMDKYRKLPAKYSRDSIKKLTTEDLKKGQGETIKTDTKFAAYYIGWNSDGTVFDQSLDDNSLKAPFDIAGLQATGVIEGWKKGLIGMKIGGVRQLNIPSDLAYGEQGSGDKIPANEPLKFIVYAIDQPKPVEVPTELLTGNL